MKQGQGLGLAGRIAAAWIDSKLTPLAVVASLMIGAFSVLMLPREEEPQIIVPMIDVMVSMPGASSREVEERVTRPMEKLLWEIPGVEYIYSTSSPGSAIAIVRFKVGEDEEKSIVKLNQKMFANFDLIPAGATQPLIKPRSIDDVPILALTLHSKTYNDFQLRQVAAQVHDAIKQVADVSEVKLLGGQRREVRVTLDPGKLASYSLSPLQVMGAIGASNRRLPAGAAATGNQEIILEAGDLLQNSAEVNRLVVAVVNGRPVYVRDIATVSDG
ncbi:MAG: efflux RND transporter permease subunit, partial [Bryobacterales bacterium]|nr:efflux RND transporter permease subunit [Bryobacterales bacterium]